jgi:hypothetical protein
VNNARLIEREVIKKLVSWLFLSRKERNCRERKLVELLVLNIKGARADCTGIATLKALPPLLLSRFHLSPGNKPNFKSLLCTSTSSAAGKRKRNSRVCLHRIKTLCVCRWAGVSLLSTPEHLSSPVCGANSANFLETRLECS